MDTNIKISDFLTSITIIVSLVALLISWSKDRYLRLKAQADKVRNAASLTLSKLERWQSIYSSFFQELQPIFVETSEILEKDHNTILTRDFLWKKITEIKTKVVYKILEEEIEVAYTSLFGYHPVVRELFLAIIFKLKNFDEEIYSKFLEISQSDIFYFEDKMENYTSAQLGNKLRRTSNYFLNEYQKNITSILEPIRIFLTELILSSDKKIIKHRLNIESQFKYGNSKKNQPDWKSDVQI